MTGRPAAETDATGRVVYACPACDASSVLTAANGYRCTQCNEHFAEPVERPPQNDTTAGNKGAAKTLADAEPGEWP